MDGDDQPTVLLGFDATEEHGLCVAVMVRHGDGDPWRIEHAFAPPGVTEIDVRAMVEKHLRFTTDRSAPPEPKAPPLAELVTEWIERFTGDEIPPLVLDEEQKAMIAAAYADDGQVGHSWWVKPTR